jgi:hypothetical protein
VLEEHDLAVVLRPISELKPYGRNARTHPPAQLEKLAASIREFGFLIPMLIDTERRIIAGHARVEAARLLTMQAARLKDAGERSDLEAGMAKLFASETGKEVVEESFRIHGGYGYSKEYEIERLYRDAPLLLIGEGTSEIQRMVIGKKLLQRHKL